MVRVPAEAKDLGKVLGHRYLWNENGLGLEDVQYTKAAYTVEGLPLLILLLALLLKLLTSPL